MNKLSHLRQHMMLWLKQFFLPYFEQFDRLLMLGMWLFLIFLMLIIWQANGKGINAQQIDNVHRYAVQFLYPHSQHFAQDLLEQDNPIYQYQYFKLLRLVDAEQQRIRQQKDQELELSRKSNKYTD